MGFDQPKSLGNREFGSSTALPIWMDFMQPNIDKLPKNKNLPPDGIVSIKIDKRIHLTYKEWEIDNCSLSEHEWTGKK